MNNEHSFTAITRRNAVKMGAGAIAGAVFAGTGAYAFPPQPESSDMQPWVNPYRDIRGFNYQPSYEATGYSIWRQFRPEKFEAELCLGKKYFPKFNTVRYWLSFDAFAVDPQVFQKILRQL
ncbi:MAG: hypothetical protein IPN67_00355 [Bacteroidales bacterium]|nr:hypothetical protein [Bacteroidales bacterium]